MEGSTRKGCEVTACLRVEGDNCDVSEWEQRMRTTNRRSKSEVESIKRTSGRRRRGSDRSLDREVGISEAGWEGSSIGNHLSSITNALSLARPFNLYTS